MRISDWSSDVCSSDLETAFSQIAHEKLGLPFEKIRIVEGDTDRIPVGLGTGGSWSVPMGGGAIAPAADRVIPKAKRIAGHLNAAAEGDIEFCDAAFTVSGTPPAHAMCPPPPGGAHPT